MAYDKVVDSAALEAGLKASADAIREKTNGTDTIPWDAVKGFAEAIAAIEAGGGEITTLHGMNFVSGTYTVGSTLTEKTRLRTIQTGYDAEPTFVYGLMYIIDGFPNNKDTKHFVGAWSYTYLNYSSFTNLYGGNRSSGGGSIPAADTSRFIGSATTINGEAVTVSLACSENSPAVAGTTYGYVVMYKA